MEISWKIFSDYKAELYGVAILWIMLFHGLVEVPHTALPQAFGFLSGFLKHGNCGVEVFLFLSGIYLYFSLKKDSNVWKFYKRRLGRVLIPFLCIDGAYWMYTEVWCNGDIISFLENITLISFWVGKEKLVWFVAFIVPCYICYPLWYRFVLKNSKRESAILWTLLVILGVYGICAGLLAFSPVWYKNVEIGLTRIPVFLLGALCGPYVYEKKEISLRLLVLSFVTCLYGMYFFYFHPNSLLKYFRIQYLLVGPALAFWFCLILMAIRSKTLDNLLSMGGGVSLELYLSHLIFKRLTVSEWTLYRYKDTANYVVYLLIVVFGSILFSLLFSNVWNKLIGKSVFWHRLE